MRSYNRSVCKDRANYSNHVQFSTAYDYVGALEHWIWSIFRIYTQSNKLSDIIYGSKHKNLGRPQIGLSNSITTSAFEIQFWKLKLNLTNEYLSQKKKKKKQKTKPYPQKKIPCWLLHNQYMSQDQFFYMKNFYDLLNI